METQTTPKNQPKSIIPEKDLQWLATLEALVKAKLSEADFSVASIADHLNINSTTLRRKIVRLTGLNSKQYIQEIQLQVARTYIESQQLETIREIALAVGFSTPAYFSRLFKERFGVLPSEYLK